MLTASTIWKLFAAPDWTSCNARIWTIITLHKTKAAAMNSARLIATHADCLRCDIRRTQCCDGNFIKPTLLCCDLVN